MPDIAYTSMLNKPCISTPGCNGSYNILNVLNQDTNPTVVVNCDTCNAQLDRYIPA
jgi:hypothetical protein